MLVVVVVVVVVIVVALAMAWATQRQGDSVGLAGARALPLTEGAALHQPFHVVMVAVLGGAHLLLETEHLGSVLAKRTVHIGVAAQHIGHPLPEGGQHRGVIP